MKYLFITVIMLIVAYTGDSQILPSAQRQKILDKESGQTRTVKANVAFVPSKVSYKSQKFKEGVIGILNEYKDDIRATVYWSKGKPDTLTILSGKITYPKYNDTCKILIYYQDRKNSCISTLSKSKKYIVTWDPQKKCYCLAVYK